MMLDAKLRWKGRVKEKTEELTIKTQKNEVALG
jgi:hypothetical protein